MPYGQSLASTKPPRLTGKSPLGPLRKDVPVSTAAFRMANERLLAQNAMLQAALDRQHTKAAELRSILSSMDMATLCVCRSLKLRLFTTAAGDLLGIGPEDVGLTLSLTGPFGLDGTPTARIRDVLDSGIAGKQVLALATGRLLMCRLLPLRAGDSAKAVDGVILTFGDVPVDPSEDGADTRASHRDSGPAAVYPDLAGGLTQRQYQVLGHVLAGHPSKNIAADLGISRRTVENHRAAIMARTGATSLPALARLAIGAEVGGDCKPAPSCRLCG